MNYKDNKIEEFYHYIEESDNAFLADEAFAFAEKAKEICPEHFEVLRVFALAEYKKTYDPAKKCELLAKAVEKANEYIKKNSRTYVQINSWDISIDGKPYINLKYHYADALVECGRMSDAKREYENILGLTHRDGFGARYRLMSIYALFEDGVKAKRLLGSYAECEGVGLFLPASVCFFKKGEIKKAEEYLLEAYGHNNYLWDLTKKSRNSNFRKSITDMYYESRAKGSYRAWSYEECVYHIVDNLFLYDSAPKYFNWAYKIIKEIKDKDHRGK